MSIPGRSDRRPGIGYMSTIPAARQKLIERIVAAARTRKHRGDPLSPETFVRHYFRGVAEEDLNAYPSAELGAAALAHLRAASVRKRNQPIVRVFNADEARDGIAQHAQFFGQREIHGKLLAAANR